MVIFSFAAAFIGHAGGADLVELLKNDYRLMDVLF